ncbi:MAG: AAA family ATPase [Bacilli bacterium]
MNRDIDVILSKMKNNFAYNKKIFLKYFTSLDYRDTLGNSLLHLVISGNGSERHKQLAINTLLINGVDPNSKNNCGDTFIHLAIQKGMSLEFVLTILSAADKHKFDINICNKYGKTIFHDAILFINSYDELLRFVSYLKIYNFNFNVVDSYGCDLNNYIYLNRCSGERENKFSLSQYDDLISSFNNNLTFNEENKLSTKQSYNGGKMMNEAINQSMVIRKYGQILNDKEFLSNPAIGRSEEIFKIIVGLAQDKKMPLLIGPSGCGKTSIVEGLAYNIKMKQVPDFLKDKLIFEISVISAIAGTKYRGDLENNMKEILDFCQRNKLILFIDEFNLVNSYGVNEEKKSDISVIIQNYIDRYNLKVIGTMTDAEYNKYMADSPLKRRFSKIKISEPNRDILYNIIVSSFDSFSQKRNISISNDISQYMDEIVNTLIELTDEKHRIQEDKVSNPDLVISIIDMAYAYAIVNSDNELKIDYLTQAILGCERIYPYSKEMAINEINELSIKKCLVRKRQPVISLSDYSKR